MTDRRSYLGLLTGALTAGVAGCLGADGPTRTDDPGSTATQAASGTPARSSTADRGTDRPTEQQETPSATPDDRRLVLERVDPVAADSLTVYPPELRAMLRQAARSGDAVRTSAETHVYAPQSVIPSFDAVELTSEDGDVDGVYAVTADSGIHYSMKVTVDAVPDADDATATPEAGAVTHVSDLPDERRELALDAIEGEHPTVEPQTELGEWVRESFFGGYVEHEGTVYRGRERQQTDAAFFSTRAWYVLSLDPVEGPAEATLRLRDVDPDVRRVVDGLLDQRRKDRPRVETDYRGDAAAVEQFAAETDAVLTHVDAFSVAVER